MTLSAAEIHEIAFADPERARSLSVEFLDEHPTDHQERARAYRALSVANRLLGDFGEALRTAELARDAAIEAGDSEEQLLAILSMTGPMTVVATTTEALQLIDASAHLATTPYLTARSSYQQGVVLMRMGESNRALEAFEMALPGLRQANDALMVRSALQNLAILRLRAGDLHRAERHLREALVIAVERDEQTSLSGIKHNLGLLAAYRGELIEALALLQDSDEIFMRITGSSAPQHVARCEVLLSAGLFGEAYRLATEIAASNRAAGDNEHLPDALLVSATAALLSGDAGTALATAGEAANVYRAGGRHGPAADADRIVIEARYRTAGASEDLLRTAGDISVALESERQMVAAAQARLLVARIAFDLGRLDAAVESLRRVSGVASGPIELRIQGRVAKARLRLIEGDRRGADAAARSGLRLIDDYQAALGATDLRMGLEQHGAELGSLGLDLAVESGRPRRIMQWMDRTRARALRHRPVMADSDVVVQETLSRLRQVESELREPDRRNDVTLQRERRRLQERVRNADRLKRSNTSTAAPMETHTLIDDLGDRALVELAIHRGRLLAVVGQQGRVIKVDIGDAQRALRELDHVRFGMRRAALMGRPVDNGLVAPLEEMLLGEIWIETEEVVLVPPPSLMAVPWAALTRLRDKPVTVSPSAEMWWRTTHRTAHGESVVVAGGPDLEMAETEVAQVGSLYPKPRLLPPGATVAEVRSNLNRAAVAHVVAHASFQVENPMFSSLRLGDGNLNVYDIERLEQPPDVVVLSACDSGYSEATPGAELAGLTSALLSMGTRSVVASVGLVPDSTATSGLMLDFHRGLIKGMGPARALSAAQGVAFDDAERFVSAASFIYVGA